MKKDPEKTGDSLLAEKTVRAYQPPVIRQFGPVGVLTQSGTGFMAENMMMMGAMRSMT